MFNLIAIIVTFHVETLQEIKIRLRKCVSLFRFPLQPTVFDWIMVWFQLSIPIFQCQIHTAEIENTVRIFGVMETTIQYMLVHKRSQSNIIRVVKENVVCLLFDDVLLYAKDKRHRFSLTLHITNNKFFS